MWSIAVTLLVTYLFVTLFGYLTHRALHQRWMGVFYKAHMVHHTKLYPPADYHSDTYRSAGKNSTSKFFVVISIPIILTLILLGWYEILPFKLVLISLLEMLILGWFHDLFHDAFHVKNHWLNKAPLFNIIFKKWNRLHFQHHSNMKRNFGIFDFIWDKALKTFTK